MTTVNNKSLTKIGCQDKTIVTIETDRKAETMSMELLRYPAAYGSTDKDERVKASFTKEEAKLIRGAIEGWIGDES